MNKKNREEMKNVEHGRQSLGLYQNLLASTKNINNINTAIIA